MFHFKPEDSVIYDDMRKKYVDIFNYDEETNTYSMTPEQAVRDQTEKNSWKNAGLLLLRDWRLYLMLVPMVVVYLLWRYAPMTELLAAFKNPNTQGAVTVAEQDWYGLTNFNTLFFGSVSSQFWAAFRNTFIIAFYGLVFGFPFPIILALFFNEIKNAGVRSIVQVCVYLPKFMSTVIITSLAMVLTMAHGGEAADVRGAGVLTNLLSLIFHSDYFTSAVANDMGLIFDSRYFRALFEITGLWEHGGYDSIVFFAAVIAISPTSYEAAQIDGAGKMQQMRYVVIPGILGTVVIMLIMKIGNLLSVGFEKVYLMSNESNYDAACIVSVFANAQGDAIGIAAEMTNNLIGMILVIGANTVARKAANVSLY